MECMSLLGFGACTPDPDIRAGMPFPVSDIIRDTIPPMLRRRSSQATQMAFTAATLACTNAGRSTATLPAIFASVAGEIQTTDQLCLELSKADGVVSPSAFHNSVQNTVAGYWSIAQQCSQPATALAAGLDTVAMAMLEAWCQLACHGGELLLVCYDESWPDYLAPGSGAPAFASALVLAAGDVEDRVAQLGKPHIGTARFSAAWQSQASKMPILATVPLLDSIANCAEKQHISLSPLQSGWQVTMDCLHQNR
jgi:Beta-ketoacyl synthase, N-terminal domain